MTTLDLFEGAEKWLWIGIPVIAFCCLCKICSCFMECKARADNYQTANPEHIEWIEHTPPELQELLFNDAWRREVQESQTIRPIRDRTSV